jgi:hypothetical protein
MRSRIEPMKKIARSLRERREPILNYFRAQKLLSSGVVEGLNNKAKVTMRKSSGFRTFRCLELALYHSPGKLPGPLVGHGLHFQPRAPGVSGRTFLADGLAVHLDFALVLADGGEVVGNLHSQPGLLRAAEGLG